MRLLLSKLFTKLSAMLIYLFENSLFMIIFVLRHQMQRKTCKSCGRNILLYKNPVGDVLDGHVCADDNHREYWS